MRNNMTAGVNMDEERAKMKKRCQNRKTIGEGKSIFDGNPEFTRVQEVGGAGGGAQVVIQDASGQPVKVAEDAKVEDGAKDADADDTVDEADEDDGAEDESPEAGGDVADPAGTQRLSEEDVRRIAAELQKGQAPPPTPPAPPPSQPPDPQPATAAVEVNQAVELPPWARALQQTFDEELLNALPLVTEPMLRLLAAEPLPITWHTEDGDDTETAFDWVMGIPHRERTGWYRFILKWRPGRQNVIVPPPGMELECTISGVRYAVRVANCEPQAGPLGWETVTMVAINMEEAKKAAEAAQEAQAGTEQPMGQSTSLY